MLEGGTLDVVSETKLLGITITSDCRWDANSKAIVLKGNSKLWFLHRLKLLGAKTDTLLDIYKLFCRSVLEFGAPVWSGALSVKNKQNIERVQKNALRIIFGNYDDPYQTLLDEIQLDSLLDRRDTLCLGLKSEKFNKWFPQGVGTRSGAHFLEPVTKTKRYRNSAIPHLTRLLNKANIS